MQSGGRGLLVAVATLLGPLGYVLGVVWPRALHNSGLPSQDFYAYRAPVLAYAHRALQQGHGLLWNDLQNCGQPFLGIPSSGVLYPPTLLLSGFDAAPGLMIWIALHLALAGGGAFLLGRTLGLGTLAACATALAVQFGGILPFTGLWSPLVFASLAWLPVVIFAAERLLQRPRATTACGLGIALTCQLVAGFPQVMVFTYLLIGLRIAWELATTPWSSDGRVLLLLASPLLFPLLLGAVYLLPAIEIAAESVRSAPIEAGGIDVSLRGEPWTRLVLKIEQRRSAGGILSIVLVLAGAAIARPNSRRITVFYLLAAGFFLALVPASPFRDLYQSLPVIGSLRGPDRFAWMTSLCLCLLAGHGIEALTTSRTSTSVRLAIAGATGGLLAFHLFVPRGVSASELGLAVAVVSVAILRWHWQGAKPAAAPLLVLALLVGMWPAATRPQLRLYTGDTQTHAAQHAFEFIASRRTPQDRVLVQPENRWRAASIAVVEKSPSLFGIPSITDYEHLTTLRYATLFFYMTTEKLLQNSGQWIASLNLQPRNASLLDLFSARYVVTDRSRLKLPGESTQLWNDDKFRVLENPSALPRAYVVPRARVIRDSRTLLARLASRKHDPRASVLLDRPPRDGFLGDTRAARGRAGTVQFRDARSEFLELAIHSRLGGFLVLTDQYFPGWNATIDGEPVEILRANYAFRAVRVPAGRSTVAFRYQPASLRWGAAISVITALALAGYWAIAYRKSRSRF